MPRKLLIFLYFLARPDWRKGYGFPVCFPAGNRSGLGSTVSVLLDHADYAYVAHPDYPERKLLVSDIYQCRALDLAATGTKPARKATPNGPRKVNKTWLPAPLPSGWYINPGTLKYEERDANGLVMTTMSAQPLPPTTAIINRMAIAQRLRRDYALSIPQPAVKGDLDSYLSYVEVKQRDIAINEIFGIESNRGWLAISKDVPENAHVEEGDDGVFAAWELADAFKSGLETGTHSRKCLSPPDGFIVSTVGVEMLSLAR